MDGPRTVQRTVQGRSKGRSKGRSNDVQRPLRRSGSVMTHYGGHYYQVLRVRVLLSGRSFKMTSDDIDVATVAAWLDGARGNEPALLESLHAACCRWRWAQRGYSGLQPARQCMTTTSPDVTCAVTHRRHVGTRPLWAVARASVPTGRPELC